MIAEIKGAEVNHGVLVYVACDNNIVTKEILSGKVSLIFSKRLELSLVKVSKHAAKNVGVFGFIKVLLKRGVVIIENFNRENVDTTIIDISVTRRVVDYGNKDSFIHKVDNDLKKDYFICKKSSAPIIKEGY